MYAYLLIPQSAYPWLLGLTKQAYESVIPIIYNYHDSNPPTLSVCFFFKYFFFHRCRSQRTSVCIVCFLICLGVRCKQRRSAWKSTGEEGLAVMLVPRMSAVSHPRWIYCMQAMKNASKALVNAREDVTRSHKGVNRARRPVNRKDGHQMRRHRRHFLSSASITVREGNGRNLTTNLRLFCHRIFAN